MAVASNFATPLRAIVDAYHVISQHEIKISVGSSGKFYAQIKQGAPFDVFLSADQIKPKMLEQENLAVAKSRFTYALGTLVLWSAAGQTSDDLLDQLKQSQFKRLSLANPRLAPYGLAASQTLDKLGLLQQTRRKWVMGENIAQAYKFVHSANAELGFVALSQVIDQPESQYWPVPAAYHQPIRQDAVMLKRGQANQVARQFLDFMQTADMHRLIQSYGYQVPK